MIRILHGALGLLLIGVAAARADAVETWTGTSDTIAVERDGAVFIVTYSNSSNQDSPEGEHYWVDDEIEFGFYLDVGAAESLTITAPYGYQAEPRRIVVRDGEEGQIILSPLIF